MSQVQNPAVLMKMIDSDRPLLSIVTTSFTMNRLCYVETLLRSIAWQTYPRLETIVVIEEDKGMYQLASTIMKNLLVSGRVVLNRLSKGASASRNMGIIQAQGELIAVVDDDVIMFPNWAEDMVRAFEDDTVIAVTGPAYPLWEDTSMSWFPDELSWMWGGTQWFQLGEGPTRDVRNVGGMNCAYRREAFAKAGLYSIKLGQWGEPLNLKWTEVCGEEVDFSLRVRRVTGKRIVFAPNASVYHKVEKFRLRWKFLAQRAFRAGYSRNMIRRAYSKEFPGVLHEEFSLLRRVMTSFLPRSFRDFPHHPSLAVRKLYLMCGVLFFLALGYLYHFVAPFSLDEEPAG